MPTDPPTAEAAETALRAWRHALGDDAVRTDAASLERLGRSTAPRAHAPGCVLYPRDAAGVQAVVAAAAAAGWPIYPVSRGRNWGYGDACPTVPGAAIVDLSRMDRITRTDADLGWVTLEPGVTQGQLHAHVRAHAPGFWADMSGAGPDASVLGNMIERGFGHTPYADHFRTVSSLEVVLANGEIVETGFGHFAGARAAEVFPYGVGPVLDGLFSQANLGIVTRATVWLCPRPEDFRFFYLRVDDPDGLAALIDALRPLRLGGVLNSAVHIGNDLRVISGNEGYPWEAAGGATPLPEALRARMRAASGVGAWNASGALVGSPAQVRAAAARLRAAVRGLGRVVFVGDTKLALGRRVAGWLGRAGLGATLSRQLDALEPNYGLLRGEPSTWALRGCQWRLRAPAADPAADPRDCGAGLMWLSPVLPIRGSDAQRLMDLVRPILARHGFDELVTFTLLNERAMVAVINLAFDKSVAADCAAAEAAYPALLAALLDAGYPPYRVGPTGMPALWEGGGAGFWRAAQAVKQALDPAGILAPGRYIPPA
jgi:4-cresol dehydrogenase (hydroxylating)